MPSNKNKTIRVEIVTPVHNRKEITLQCLRSIARLDSDGFDIHTVIVDDGSSDGTGEAIAAEFPDVEVVRGDGNLWFTEATNVGVRAALCHDPDYVLMINDDQVFDARALRLMVECAERHPATVIGPLLLLWDTPHKVFQTAPVWTTFGGGWHHWFNQTVWTVPDRPFEVDIIVGNCVLIPIDAIREAGLMNSERYPIYGDAEYTPRLKRKGWRLLIEPAARVFCQPNTPPAAVKQMPFGAKLRNLFVDMKHPHNLRRRYYSVIDAAPGKLSGIVAFIIFFIRLGLGMNAEGFWAFRREEVPLSDTFRGRVVESEPVREARNTASLSVNAR